ncbi:hypothetical protein [Neobacillus terrae]|uniref:hypothetical protein n=1 Tax=Neobacillus terrae TaxID=3034837 RepID=UPI00140E17E7|nr:hypothetical protein [Neobacillus terrae]NHM31972.1 hypothetical protein [Neobacillus terrae]
MEKIKAFLKIESDFLRDTVLLLFSLSVGSAMFFYSELAYKLKGALFIIFSFVMVGSIIKEFKRIMKIINQKR